MQPNCANWLWSSASLREERLGKPPAQAPHEFPSRHHSSTMMNGVPHTPSRSVPSEILYHPLGSLSPGTSIIVGSATSVPVVFGFDAILGVAFGFPAFLSMVERMCSGFLFFRAGVVFPHWGLIQTSECFLAGEPDVRTSFALCQTNLVPTMTENRLGFRFLACALASVVVLCAFHGVHGEAFPEANCEDLGFTGLALCSDCDSLAEYVKDKELEADCRKCCAEESENALSKMKYAGAVLEICLRKVMFYPNIQIFIDDKLSEFPEVDVKYRFGAPPKLIMKDDKGNLKESIRIDNWKTEQIEQFLSEKVLSNASI